MEEEVIEPKLWGVKLQSGRILQIADADKAKALKRAAMRVFGRGGASSVGKLTLAGASLIQVKIVANEE